MAEEVDLEKCIFLELQKLCELDLELGRGHTGPHKPVNVYPHTKLDPNRKNFLWTEVWSDG